jgi:5-formyltetrahydrofolate cyclo-ligase
MLNEPVMLNRPTERRLRTKRMSDKPAIRAAALAVRRSTPPGERAAADRALIRAAADLVHGAGSVAAYVPMPGEPGGPALVDALAAVVGSLLLPVVDLDLDLDWVRYDPSAGLSPPVRPGVRLREPVGPRLGPDAISLCYAVLVPALAVDHLGTRLGRGGGSFDRALARVARDTPVVALLYEGEVRGEALPTEPHDRPVTAVLTPSGVRALPWAS